jgi:hypothetical protein
MTQSTASGVLANQPASGFPSMGGGGGGGNSNLGLMRLVFSAIFHMQKKLSENDEHGEEGGEGEEEEKGGEGREGERGKEGPGETTLEVPTGRVTLPPIGPTKSAKNVSNGLQKTESVSVHAHAQKPPASPASVRPRPLFSFSLCTSRFAPSFPPPSFSFFLPSALYVSVLSLFPFSSFLTVA